MVHKKLFQRFVELNDATQPNLLGDFTPQYLLLIKLTSLEIQLDLKINDGVMMTEREHTLTHTLTENKEKREMKKQIKNQ